jgi:hypothetical protein
VRAWGKCLTVRSLLEVPPSPSEIDQRVVLDSCSGGSSNLLLAALSRLCFCVRREAVSFVVVCTCSVLLPTRNPVGAHTHLTLLLLCAPRPPPSHAVGDLQLRESSDGSAASDLHVRISQGNHRPCARHSIPHLAHVASHTKPAASSQQPAASSQQPASSTATSEPCSAASTASMFEQGQCCGHGTPSMPTVGARCLCLFGTSSLCGLHSLQQGRAHRLCIDCLRWCMTTMG